MTEDYHKYIYDIKGRRIIGDFEGAYRDCDCVWPSQLSTDDPKHAYVRDMIRRADKPRVLDIGCGYGAFVRELAALGADAHGFEISPSAVRKGKERYGADLPIEIGNLTQGLPAEDDGFDIVLLFGVFWYLLDDLPKAMRELRRVMRTNAQLVVSVYIPENPIRGEIMGSYRQFHELVSAHFLVTKAFLSYDSADLEAGASLVTAKTDMVLICGPVA